MGISSWNVIDDEACALSLTYTFAKDATANCFAARMSNGELMVVSPAVGLTEEAATQLEEYGKVGALVANNGFHHMGQASWRERFPDARAFAPDVAAARIHKKTGLDFEPMDALAELAGDAILCREVPNTKLGESWFAAKSGSGFIWFASDMLMNRPDLPKFPFSLLFSLTKSAPGYRVFNLSLKFVVKDRAEALNLLRADVESHTPIVVVPGHGDIVDGPDTADRTIKVIDT